MVTYNASSINTVTTVTAGTGVTMTDTGTDGNHIYEIKSTGFSAMPSSRTVQLTIPGNDESVTAPGDGYLGFSGRIENGDGWVGLTSNFTSLSYINSDINNNVAYAWIPVIKNSNTRLSWRSATPLSLIFIYANGN